MRIVVQRVTRAAVSVDGSCVGSIDRPGLVLLVGVSHEDTLTTARAMATKIAGLRILRGDISALDCQAPVLVISQFTLYADTRKGRRPSWSGAAPGPVAEPIVDAVAEELRQAGLPVATGRFGADMAVDLVNDGPVTIIVES